MLSRIQATVLSALLFSTGAHAFWPWHGAPDHYFSNGPPTSLETIYTPTHSHGHGGRPSYSHGHHSHAAQTSSTQASVTSLSETSISSIQPSVYPFPIVVSSPSFTPSSVPSQGLNSSSTFNATTDASERSSTAVPNPYPIPSYPVEPTDTDTEPGPIYPIPTAPSSTPASIGFPYASSNVSTPTASIPVFNTTKVTPVPLFTTAPHPPSIGSWNSSSFASPPFSSSLILRNGTGAPRPSLIFVTNTGGGAFRTGPAAGPPTRTPSGYTGGELKASGTDTRKHSTSAPASEISASRSVADRNGTAAYSSDPRGEISSSSSTPSAALTSTTDVGSWGGKGGGQGGYRASITSTLTATASQTAVTALATSGADAYESEGEDGEEGWSWWGHFGVQKKRGLRTVVRGGASNGEERRAVEAVEVNV